MKGVIAEKGNQPNSGYAANGFTGMLYLLFVKAAFQILYVAENKL